MLITRNPIWTLDLRVIKATTSRSLRLPFSVSFHFVSFGPGFCGSESRPVPRCVCVTCVLMKYWILLPACPGRAVNNFRRSASVWGWVWSKQKAGPDSPASQLVTASRAELHGKKRSYLKNFLYFVTEIISVACYYNLIFALKIHNKKLLMSKCWILKLILIFNQIISMFFISFVSYKKRLKPLCFIFL